MRPRYRLRTRLYSSDLTANHLAVTNTVMSTNSAAKGGGICLLNDTKRGLMETNFSNTIITENTATERFMFIGTQCDLWGRPDGTGHEKISRGNFPRLIFSLIPSLSERQHFIGYADLIHDSRRICYPAKAGTKVVQPVPPRSAASFSSERVNK